MGERARHASALAGPGVFKADGSSQTFGLQGRIDGATPALHHVAAVLSLHGATLPGYRGGALHLAGLGLGARIR
jgi:hypothetical protein